MPTYSPLRYPGGKGKLVFYFRKLIRRNGLIGGTYVEPYAGGASVGLDLLINEYVSKIIINDVDRSIYAFWYSVLNETENLCNLIMQTPVNVASWRKQREIQRKKDSVSLLDLGFSTLFLNRTNHSGILRGGVIGGKKQEGEWKIDARYNKKELLRRIMLIASYRGRIEVYNLDAVDLIRKLRPKLPGKTLLYLDPPYYVKGKDLYLNYYQSSDHEKISREIKKVTIQKWVVTYDDRPFIRSLYKELRKYSYSLRYSAAKYVSQGGEVMIFSNNIVAGTRSVKNFV